MSPLNIHPEENVDTSKKKKSNKTLKVLLGVGVLVLVPVIGSTLAANIGINNDTPIQFGQGVQRAVVCDDDITLTANAIYANAANAAGTFTLGPVVFTDILAACKAKAINVSVYNNSDNASPLAVCKISSYAAADGNPCATGSTADLTWSANVADSNSATDNTLTIQFDALLASPIPSSDVYNITIETL